MKRIDELNILSPKLYTAFVITCRPFVFVGTLVARDDVRILLSSLLWIGINILSAMCDRSS